MPSDPPPVPAAAHRPAAPPAAVVHVVARRGGITQAILFVVTLGVLAGVFLVGLTFGTVAGLMGGEEAGFIFEVSHRAGAGDRVALIGIEGPIGEELAEEVRLSVDHVLADPTFRAVLLRVDSPGGAVSPSDRIWHEVERLKDAGLPVVASYGGVAASGGVYVSCGADQIVCEPTGVTGSVGVIASVLTFGGLLEKVGVEPVTMVASGSPKKADANDIYRSWSTVDKAVVQSLIDRSYALFNRRVIEGRTGKAADIDVLATTLDGRVLTADEAVAVGLVDSVGYISDAIAAIEARLGAPGGSCDVVRLFRPKPFWAESLLLGAVSQRDGAGARGTAARRPLDADAVRDLVNDLARPRLEFVFR